MKRREAEGWSRRMGSIEAKMRVLLSGLFVLCVLNASLAAEEWGDLKMRFVREGAGAKRGIPDVCVWLLPGIGQRVPVHPDYEKSARDQVRIAIVESNVIPAMTTIRTTQTLVITNRDQVGYNIKGDFFLNDSFNRSLVPGQSCEVSFTKPENTPVTLTCTIHPSLRGWVLVRDDPYGAVSDAEGGITISKVPRGKWNLAVYRQKYVTQVIREGQPIGLMRGRLPVEINAGANDLGEMVIPKWLEP